MYKRKVVIHEDTEFLDWYVLQFGCKSQYDDKLPNGLKVSW